MYKKGLLFRNIVAGIVVLVIAGILLLIVTNILRSGGETSSREACRTSVLLREQTAIFGEPLYGGTLECETDVLEVESRDEEKIYETITNEMYDCWYQFGEGELDFEGEWDFWEGDNWCFVCSRLDFGDGTQEEYSELEGLFNYLKTEKVPFSEDQTFFEYFYGETYVSNVQDFEIATQNFEEKYSTQEPLYITFFSDKRTTGEDVAESGYVALGTAVTLCGAGIVSGIFSFGTTTVLACSAAGTIVGTTYLTTSKSGTPQGLYIGNSDDVLGRCNQ